MKNLTNLTYIKKLLSRHNFKFSKSLGQNFLINPYICPKMAIESDTNKNTGVLEIGPGIGVLTYELAKISKKVVALEIDSRLIPILNETLNEFSNTKIINCDILKVDLKEIIEKEFHNMDVIICANLPYYITSPIIMKLISENLPIKSVTAMVQKEVAHRFCAGDQNRNTGSISIAIKYYTNSEIIFHVEKDSFFPAPKIDSSIIKLTLRKTPLVDVTNKKLFFKTVRAAFSQRRKTLLNSLTYNMNISKNDMVDILNKLNINLNIRAENLTIEQFTNISNLIDYNLKFQKKTTLSTYK